MLDTLRFGPNGAKSTNHPSRSSIIKFTILSTDNPVTGYAIELTCRCLATKLWLVTVAEFARKSEYYQGEFIAGKEKNQGNDDKKVQL